MSTLYKNNKTNELWLETDKNKEYEKVYDISKSYKLPKYFVIETEDEIYEPFDKTELNIFKKDLIKINSNYVYLKYRLNNDTFYNKKLMKKYIFTKYKKLKSFKSKYVFLSRYSVYLNDIFKI